MKLRVIKMSITNDISPVILPETGYFRQSASAALTAIVSPVTNENGIILYTLNIVAGGATFLRLMFKDSAPTGWNDNTAFGIATSSSDAWIQVPLPVLIPPGFGLYEQSSGAVLTTIDIVYKII